MCRVKGMHDSSVGRAPAEKTGAILTRFRVSDVAREFSPNVSFQCRLSYDAILTRVRVPDVAREFSPNVSFQCRLSYDAILTRVRVPDVAREFSPNVLSLIHI